jgi:hypothetical protein
MNQPSKAISSVAEELAKKLTDNEPAPQMNDQVNDQVVNQVTENAQQEVQDVTENAQQEVQQTQEVSKTKPSRSKKTKTEQAPVGQQEQETAETAQEAKVVEMNTSQDEAGLDDYEKDFISFLNDDDSSYEETGLRGEAPDEREEKKKYQEIESKLQEYENTLNDPLIAAFAEFVKSGNTDVNEFAKQVGDLSVGEMDIEDMYRARAVEMGFDGDDLDDAVMEQLDKYNSMTRLERKDEENKLKSLYKSQSAERLKSFTEKITNQKQAEQQRMNEIASHADKELDEVLNKMKGQRWKSLLIDESMANNIKETIPAMAPLMAQLDDNNRLTGFDVKEGIEMAIWKLYGKQLLKSTFDIGRTAGFDEAMKDRLRPSSTTGSSASPAVPGNSLKENIEAARKQAAERVAGRRSLIDMLGNK